VIAKSFARIHAANLVNAGILPLVFEDEQDYEKLSQGDRVIISDIHEGLKKGHLKAEVLRGGQKAAEIPLRTELAERQKNMLLAGGLLKYTALN
jgi:aconitate hydratase